MDTCHDQLLLNPTACDRLIRLVCPSINDSVHRDVMFERNVLWDYNIEFAFLQSFTTRMHEKVHFKENGCTSCYAMEFSF